MTLSGNRLSGTIPQYYASLTKLQVLRLDHNGLQGSLPAVFVSLRKLEVLDLSDNHLTCDSLLAQVHLMRKCDMHYILMYANSVWAFNGVPWAQLGSLEVGVASQGLV
jgi:Leucine-rich repeat (LRR) protein